MIWSIIYICCKWYYIFMVIDIKYLRLLILYIFTISDVLFKYIYSLTNHLEATTLWWILLNHLYSAFQVPDLPAFWEMRELEKCKLDWGSRFNFSPNLQHLNSRIQDIHFRKIHLGRHSINAGICNLLFHFFILNQDSPYCLNNQSLLKWNIAKIFYGNLGLSIALKTKKRWKRILEKDITSFIRNLKDTHVHSFSIYIWHNKTLRFSNLYIHKRNL